MTQRHELHQAVATYTERAAEKLRRQGLAVSVLRVFVTTNPFKPQEPQYVATRAARLPVATADTTRLLAMATRLVDGLWREGYRFKKAGVELLELVEADNVQGDLWTEADPDKRKALMAAVDELNAEYGRATVKFAASGVRQGWTLRSDQRSPHYTTAWDELLRVE